MGVVATCAVVPATPAQVAAWLTDPAKVSELDPDVEAFELSGPLAVGARVREVRRVLGRRKELVWTVTEYEPARRIVLEWSGKSMDVTGAIDFEPVDGGTRISTHNDLRPRGAARIVMPLVERAVAREERILFDRLRARLQA